MPITPTKNHLPSWFDYDFRRTAGHAGIEILTSLDKGGVDYSMIPEAEQARAIAAEAAGVAAEFEEARKVAPAVTDLAEQVATGKLTPAKAAVKAAPLDALTAPNGPVAALAKEVAQTYAKRIHATLAAPGDKWVTDCLRPHVDAVVAPLLDLVDALPDDTTDEIHSHYSHDRTIREAFGRILDIVTTLRPAMEAHHAIRCAGLIPPTPRHNAGDYWYADPQALDGLRIGGTETVAMVIGAARRGQAPTLLTADEVAMAIASTGDGPVAA